jgi:Mrp family chromosome partitioning ATPase
VPPVVRAFRQPVAPVAPPSAVEMTTPVRPKTPPNTAPEVPATRAYAAEAPPSPETFPGLPPETFSPETPSAPATPIEETNEMGPAYHRIDAPQTPDPPAWTANEPGAKAAPEVPFRPLLQVDRFAWPQVCARLAQSVPAELDRLADQLLAAGERGARVVGLAAPSAGSGVSTAVLCAARQLAGRGVRVALVDGNLADPQLAGRLGLLPEFGLEELLAGRQPLDEIVIESAAEPVVVVPLCRPGDEELDGDAAARLRRALATLAGAYDLVLLDLGSLDAASAAGFSLVRALAGRLGGVALVQHAEGTTKERVSDTCRALAQQGVEVWGLIENFTRR